VKKRHNKNTNAGVEMTYHVDRFYAAVSILVGDGHIIFPKTNFPPS
jgi:hypothetical protein